MDDNDEGDVARPTIFDKMRITEERVARSEIDGTEARAKYAIDLDELMYAANDERNRHLDRIANSLDRISSALTGSVLTHIDH